ncbi:hypothetical protein HOY80DRAFT_975223 [Tuber brumale]|nr:hypothetical protein HOY80DRAFT_975223 [Tuber brumale]
MLCTSTRVSIILCSSNFFSFLLLFLLRCGACTPHPYTHTHTPSISFFLPACLLAVNFMARNLITRLKGGERGFPNQKSSILFFMQYPRS